MYNINIYEISTNIIKRLICIIYEILTVHVKIFRNFRQWDKNSTRFNQKWLVQKKTMFKKKKKYSNKTRTNQRKLLSMSLRTCRSYAFAGPQRASRQICPLQGWNKLGPLTKNSEGVQKSFSTMILSKNLPQSLRLSGFTEQ